MMTTKVSKQSVLYLCAAGVLLLGILMLAFSRKQVPLKVFGTLFLTTAFALVIAAYLSPSATSKGGGGGGGGSSGAPSKKQLQWNDQNSVVEFGFTDPPAAIHSGSSTLQEFGHSSSSGPAPTQLVAGTTVTPQQWLASSAPTQQRPVPPQLLAAAVSLPPQPLAATVPLPVPTQQENILPTVPYYDSVMGSIAKPKSLDAAPAAPATPHVPYWAHLPTPESIRLEREWAANRPDTPALDRARRQVGLMEAAAELRAPRDGFLVPLA
jgi:hypothetical protein